mmetsp:Transcript_30931/g.100727  ORF Transcript_30931/g.100727 Transcript_30931/m.100727 type:complete len:90 (-) Transcript_30931:1308-1577(-)
MMERRLRKFAKSFDYPFQLLLGANHDDTSGLFDLVAAMRHQTRTASARRAMKLTAMADLPIVRHMTRRSGGSWQVLSVLALHTYSRASP